MFGKYEKEAYQFLAVYRFLSYALAVMFTQISPSPLISTNMGEVQLYIILGVLGVYSGLRVFSHLRWRERGMMTYLILLGDFLICLVLVMYTDGLNSVFLLYSLTPIMTAALLFDEKIALSLAATASIVLSITHIALSQFADKWTWILQGYNLGLLVIYTLFSLVIAIVPYRTNLNIRRRIESQAIIDERRRMAREIHDGVAQSLGYLNMKTKIASDAAIAKDTEKTIKELNDIRMVVQDTYDDIRESIDQLSTEMKNITIANALSNYINDFSTRHSIDVTFDYPKPFTGLSPVAELQLLRIAQEALTNVRRHAFATEVEVKLINGKNSTDLFIKDNGKGFNQNEISIPPGYHGLDIIKERAETLGGNVQITTAPGKGTTVLVSLPYNRVRM